MEVLGGVGVDLIASVLFTSAGFGLARLYESLKARRRFGYVNALLGTGRRITVVFPGAGPTRELEGRPANAIGMSLAEGAAITRVGVICRDARPGTEMYLVHPNDFHPARGPFVIIGDPADAAWSRVWVANSFPQLCCSAERHCVEFDGARWETRIDNNVVIRDFGLIIVGVTSNAHHFAILWGASEFGVNIAARAFGDLYSQLSRERYKKVVAGESWMYVAQGDVDGYGVRTDDVSNVSIVAAYRSHNNSE